MDVISCRQVKKSYAGKCVLDAVELTVKQGDFFGLVGMNGGGKSTLIKSILDLVAIDAGEIRISGKPHRQISARSDIAYLPDRFSPPTYLKAIDFIAYMLSLYGEQHKRSKIESKLVSLGLETAVLDNPVSSLSKGMTQKLGLAACLLSNKKLLILDEPMSGLDPKARVLFKKQLLALKDRGASVFFSSHVLADVDELADSMAVLHEGRVLFSGTPEVFKQAYQGENLEQAYMCCIETG